MIGQLIPILFNDGLTPEYKAYKARVAADSGTLTIVSDKNFSDQVKSLKQSGVYDQASLICIPSGSKIGKLYSLKPTDGTGDFTVSRNSVKWVRGKDGYYREVPVNVPGLEWSPSAQKFGVLAEPQATNLCQKSFDFTNSAWGKGASTIEGDLATTTTEHITSENNRSFTDGTIGNWLSVTNGSGSMSYDAEKGCGKIVVGSTPGTYNYARLYYTAMNGLISGDLVVAKADFYIPATDIVGPSGVGITVRAASERETSSNVVAQRDQWVTAYVFLQVDVVTYFYIDIRFNPGPQTAGNVLYFDNISVKKVQGFDCPFLDSSGVNLKRGFKLIESSAAGTHYLQNVVTGVTSGSQITISVFAKYYGSKAQFLISDEYIGAASQGLFNLQTGTVVSGGATSKSITHIVDGWYLCSVTYTTSVTGVAVRFYLHNGSSVSYAGDGVSGLLISQASVVQADAASSPIFTDGATVTRLADSMSLINNILSKSNFTIYISTPKTIAATTASTLDIGIMYLNHLYVGQTALCRLALGSNQLFTSTSYPASAAKKSILRANNGVVSWFLNGYKYTFNDNLNDYPGQISQFLLRKDFVDLFFATSDVLSDDLCIQLTQIS